MSVFVVLALIWAAVLIPPVLRARAEQRAEFIDSFRAQMGALGNRRAVEKPSAPTKAKPRRRTSRARRRRDILGGLLGAMLGSLVLGAFPSLRIAWVLHLFLLNSFLGYLCLLAHGNAPARRRPAISRPRREPALKPAFDSAR